MAQPKTGRLYHKAFNFDMVIAELKKHYPNGHHTKAYKEIGAFMHKNGFEHRQGSGYRSKAPLSDVEVLDIVDKLYAALPWFTKCVNKFDVTNVGEVYDLATMYKDALAIEMDIAPAPKQK